MTTNNESPSIITICGSNREHSIDALEETIDSVGIHEAVQTKLTEL